MNNKKKLLIKIHKNLTKSLIIIFIYILFIQNIKIKLIMPINNIINFL